VAIHEVGLEHPSLDEVFSTVTHRRGERLPGEQPAVETAEVGA
jgi:hypothetical protein